MLVFALLGIPKDQNIFAQNNSKNGTDITFYIVADTHFDPPPESDQYYHTVAMNSVCGTIGEKTAAIWPTKIDGKETEFGSGGQEVDIPKGVIMAGDITDRADPVSLELLKSRYEMGDGDKVINFPVYVGLGNHDLDPQHVGDSAETYKNYMLDYVAERHRGECAPVPTINFDDISKNYSWDWEGVHFVQTHRFAGNTENDHPNSIMWLKEDLKVNASDGKPVVIIQHYGFDKWSWNWWSDEKKEALSNTIKNYNIVGIFVGHNHIAENFIWNGINVFQVNNAWPDRDGNGSFSICRITDTFMDVVTCRWKNGEGDTEFVKPFFTKNLNN